MDGSALRAETADGQIYDAPSETLLLRLLDELGPANQFLVIDRLDADEQYMQIYREINGMFAVEYRDGGMERHFETVTADLRTVSGVLIGWAAGTAAWRDACAWRRWPVE